TERTYMSDIRTSAAAQRRERVVDAVGNQIAIAAVAIHAAKRQQPRMRETAVRPDEPPERLLTDGDPLAGQHVQRRPLTIIAPPAVVRPAQARAERAHDAPGPQVRHRRAATRNVRRVDEPTALSEHTSRPMAVPGRHPHNDIRRNGDTTVPRWRDLRH